MLSCAESHKKDKNSKCFIFLQIEIISSFPDKDDIWWRSETSVYISKDVVVVQLLMHICADSCLWQKQLSSNKSFKSSS